MPRGDSTGPMGMGPMTGRQAGYCAGYHMPGSLNIAGGRGMGMGYGRGGGFRRRSRFFATGMPGGAQFGSFAASFPQSDPKKEKQALKSQAEYLQSELEAIKKRLEELTTMNQDK